MIRRPPRSTQSRSSAASDVYKRQIWECRQSLSTGLKSLSKAFCKLVCGNADKVCLEITSFSLFSDSIINFVSSHRVRRLSLESSHHFESSCCLARTDLHSSACERASQFASERECVRAFERQRAASSSEVHSSFVISSLGTKLGCFYITIACRIGMNN